MSRPQDSSARRVNRQLLSSQVAEAIEHELIRPGLRPDDKLPSSDELADRYGVSRTVIREALAALEGRGLLERSQGREARVATPGGEHLRSVITTLFAHDELNFTEIHNVREVLEVRAASLAAQHRAPEDIARMRRELDRMHAARTPAEFVDADFAFHAAIADASGNRLIALVLRSMEPLIRHNMMEPFGDALVHDKGFEGTLELHATLADMIATGDATGAARSVEWLLESVSRDLARKDVHKRDHA